MVKGCRRTIVQIKETGSPWFTEAYFVLSEEADDRREGDIVEAATRLVAEELGDPLPSGGNFWPTLAGFLSGVFLCGVAFLLYRLLS